MGLYETPTKGYIMTKLEAAWENNEHPLEYENQVLREAIANGDAELAFSAIQRIAEYQGELIEALYSELTKPKKNFICRLFRK